MGTELIEIRDELGFLIAAPRSWSEARRIIKSLERQGHFVMPTTSRSVIERLAGYEK